MSALQPLAIEVRIWGRRVGAVAVDPAIAAHAFEYDPAWLRRGCWAAARGGSRAA